LFIQIDLDDSHTRTVGRQHGLLVHVARPYDGYLFSLAVEQREPAGVGFKKLSDDFRSLYGVRRKLGLSGNSSQQQCGKHANGDCDSFGTVHVESPLLEIASLEVVVGLNLEMR